MGAVPRHAATALAALGHPESASVTDKNQLRACVPHSTNFKKLAWAERGFFESFVNPAIFGAFA
ncbi:hypothetical protein AUP40_09215 [Thalassospira xiamenensis]|uniref:Uncharacterized protein n=1 Tax=Thalassospira xiamenensis TaxID=220697 RepID=A0ABR5Y5G4_9PROT|nr:hypothetical protein AUP40_09215 [Thalassospira xiamenensis]MAB33978.1 hypothetical protein [Thalassospira sp.]OHZ02375.1 hypothetical protein BC440_15785 [Thalassospira sp. MIT1004]KZD10515.1 hypothetical protein AUP45_11030 [Thalassospira xiamenensis]MBA05364.1 hypothetical protein [Thalassospira sp.]